MQPTHPPDPEAILQLARQIAAAENGCACSGEDLPEPTGEQYQHAQQLLATPNPHPSRDLAADSP